MDSRARWTWLGRRVARPLQQHHLAWPHGAREAFIEFVEALSRPARELDLHASDTSPALPAARAAARRARPGNRTSRIKPMQAPVERSLSAIRQRFMPHLRRQVGTRIRAARQAHVRVQRQRPRPVPLTSQQISRQINRPSHELTAAFLRAFYPWFGAGTTAEHVRKVPSETPSVAPAPRRRGRGCDHAVLACATLGSAAKGTDSEFVFTVVFCVRLEGCIRAMTPVPTWTRPSKGGPCWCDRSEGPMTGASTSANHVTATSNGSGPRATSAEEPDGGNLQVRIW